MSAAYPGLVDAIVYDKRGEAGQVIGWEEGYLMVVMKTGKIARLDPMSITVGTLVEIADPKGEPS